MNSLPRLVGADIPEQLKDDYLLSITNKNGSREIRCKDPANLHLGTGQNGLSLVSGVGGGVNTIDSKLVYQASELTWTQPEPSFQMYQAEISTNLDVSVKCTLNFTNHEPVEITCEAPFQKTISWSDSSTVYACVVYWNPSDVGHLLRIALTPSTSFFQSVVIESQQSIIRPSLSYLNFGGVLQYLGSCYIYRGDTTNPSGEGTGGYYLEPDDSYIFQKTRVSGIFKYAEVYYDTTEYNHYWRVRFMSPDTEIDNWYSNKILICTIGQETTYNSYQEISATAPSYRYSSFWNKTTSSQSSWLYFLNGDTQKYCCYFIHAFM